MDWGGGTVGVHKGEGDWYGKCKLDIVPSLHVRV